MARISIQAPAFEGPALSTAIAKIAIFGLTAISTHIGVEYWLDQGEDSLALLTISAEAVALVGFHLAKDAFDRGAGRQAAGAALITAMAAGWCGLTTFEKLQADALEQRQIQLAADVTYQQALKDVQEAANGLQSALAAVPPDGLNSYRINAWNAGKAATVDSWRSVRADADARLEKATPPPKDDWLAIVRGVGVELAKAFGWVVFGAGAGATRTSGRRNERSGHSGRQGADIPEERPMTPSEKGRALNACRKDRQAPQPGPDADERPPIRVVRNR
jgi:hypothetical protein